MLARVNQWNVSPKLENSGESLEDRLNEAALAVLRDSGRAYLKLVVGSVAEAAEAERLAAELEWPRDRVQLMPLAAAREELSARSGWWLEKRSRAACASPRVCTSSSGAAVAESR